MPPSIPKTDDQPPFLPGDKITITLTVEHCEKAYYDGRHKGEWNVIPKENIAHFYSSEILAKLQEAGTRRGEPYGK